ncbi:hypothetical protein MA16_Dca007322 [Dendrobium catenatum]|uniref:Retrovirus-related Pol polyprotein from transposon TNT 1-94-like beta-barrel domain-containing protein n=1 Tax=Dendrobium catenatum TaxID=906689 RepID=A0A2I0W8G0_9ASPA|nr:hypothetical protein MA16_Dca007322 [Dendrobium catenatum]
MWYLDSGCSRHMTGDKAKLFTLESNDGGYVTYGDNAKGKIIAIGSIYKNSITLEKVVFVSGLKHNLISISQLCDKGLNVSFYASHCIIINNETILLIGNRYKNIYLIDLENTNDVNLNLLCMKSINDDAWL